MHNQKQCLRSWLLIGIVAAACGEEDGGGNSMDVGAVGPGTPTNTTAAMPEATQNAMGMQSSTGTTPMPTATMTSTPTTTTEPVMPTTTVSPMPTVPEGMGGAGGEPMMMPAGPSNVPADEGAAAMSAFVLAEAYKGDEWTAETDGAVREASSAVSPHGRVTVYLNATLVESLAAGNGGLGSTTGISHSSGSMAVKEFYDDADALVGIGALYKYGEGDSDWSMWCYGPASSCSTTIPDTTPETPYHEVNGFACSSCHAGNIFTDPNATE